MNKIQLRCMHANEHMRLSLEAIEELFDMMNNFIISISAESMQAYRPKKKFDRNVTVRVRNASVDDLLSDFGENNQV